MKRNVSIFSLLEGRGAGGPTVTVHLPQKLAEDLLHVLHEALEVSGMESPEGDEEEEAEDEDELDDDFSDEFDDGEPGADDLFGMGDEGGGEEDRVAGEEPDDEDDSGDDEVDIEDGYEPGAQGADIDDDGMNEKHIGFKKLVGMLKQREGKVTNPGGLAYDIGVKKYGKAGMARKAAAGRKKH